VVCPAVTKPELEREMRVMKEGGIGGFEVQPVYPLTLAIPDKELRIFRFCRTNYIDALRFVSAKSRELGLRMDLRWAAAGPWRPQFDDQAAGMLRSERSEVSSGPTSCSRAARLCRGKVNRRVFGSGARQGIDPDSIREITNIKDGVVSCREAQRNQVNYSFSSPVARV